MFRELFTIAQRTVTRRGFDSFVANWAGVAASIVAELVAARTNADFRSVRQEAFNKLKALSGEARDTWVILLVDFAWNHQAFGKARNWFIGMFKKVWNFVRRYAPFTASILEKRQAAAIDIVRRAREANSNKEFAELVPLIEAELRLLYKELDESSIALLVNFAYEYLKGQTQREMA